MPKINPGTRSPINSEEVGPSSVEQVDASSVHASGDAIRENILDAIECNDRESLNKYIRESPMDVAVCCFDLLRQKSTDLVVMVIRSEVVCQNIVQLLSKEAEYSEENKLKMAQILTNSGYVIRNSDDLPECIQHMLSTRAKNALMFYGYKNYKHEPERRKVYQSGDGNSILMQDKLCMMPRVLRHQYKEFLIDGLDDYRKCLTAFGDNSDQSMPMPHAFMNKKYGELDFNINGDLFANKDDKEPLVCKHLSVAFLDAYKNKIHKDFLRKLKSDNAVLTQKSYLRLEVDSFLHFRDPSVVVGNEKFGDLLFDLQKKLQPGQGLAFDLTSPFKINSADQCGHAMALVIEKLSEDHHSMVKVSIYDPNSSANLMHLERLPEHLHDLRISDFMGESVFKSYTDNNSMIVSGATLMEALGNESPGIRYVNEDINSQVSALAMALIHGRYDYIEEVMQSKSIGRIDGAYLKNILLIKIFGSPLIHAIFSRNHAPIIHTLGQFLKDLKLDSASVRELLTAKDPQGETVLSIAIRDDYIETVRALGKILGELSLTDDDLKEILKAEAGPLLTQHPLALAMASRQQSAIAFLEILEQFKLELKDVGCDERILADVLRQLKTPVSSSSGSFSRYTPRLGDTPLNWQIETPSNTSNLRTPTGLAAMQETPVPGEKPKQTNEAIMDTKLDFSQD